MCRVMFRFLYLHHFPQKNPHMYNKRNEFKRLILFAVRTSSRRPTLKKDSNGYNNAGQGTFFNTVSKNLPKKNRCSHVRQKPNLTLMMITFKCQWKWAFDPRADLQTKVLPVVPSLTGTRNDLKVQISAKIRDEDIYSWLKL